VVDKDNLIEKVKELTDKKGELERKVLVLDTKIDSLEETKKEKLQELKDKYDFNSLEDAREYLEKKESELKTKIEGLEEELSAYDTQDDDIADDFDVD